MNTNLPRAAMDLYPASNKDGKAVAAQNVRRWLDHALRIRLTVNHYIGTKTTSKLLECRNEVLIAGGIEAVSRAQRLCQLDSRLYFIHSNDLLGSADLCCLA